MLGEKGRLADGKNDLPPVFMGTTTPEQTGVGIALGGKIAPGGRTPKS
jgi:hypothetical protein